MKLFGWAVLLLVIAAAPAEAAYSSGRSSSGGGSHSSFSSGTHSYSSGTHSSSSSGTHTYSSPTRSSFGSAISQGLVHAASQSAWQASSPRPAASAPQPSFPASQPSVPRPPGWGTSQPPPMPAPSTPPYAGIGGGTTVVLPVPIPIPYQTRTYSTYGSRPSYSSWGGYSQPAPPVPPGFGATAGTPLAPPIAGSGAPPGTAPPRQSHTGLIILGLLLVVGMGAVLAWTLWSARAAARQGQPQSEPSSGFFNPLNLKPGLYFSLDLSDYDGLQFRIEEIRDYTVRLAGGTFHFAAYCGISHEPGKEPVRVQVRVEDRPKIGPESAGLLNAVALHTIDEFGFKQDFYQVVTDGTGLFQVTDDATGAVKAEYHRPTDATALIPATVASLKDTEGAGKADPRQAAISQVEYWDYQREVEGGGTEFLIVELDKKDGWFRILSGPEIDISRVKA